MRTPLLPTPTFLRTTVFSIVCSVAAMVVANRTEAVPVQYYLNWTLPGGFDHLSGTFTLDPGTALGTYNAESFWGLWSLSPNPDRPWINVAFEAVEGSFAILKISIREGYTAVASSAIGGGTILPGSTAILEWQHYFAAFPSRPTPIGTLTTSPVPDHGLSMPLIAAVLGGLCLVGCRQRERCIT